MRRPPLVATILVAAAVLVMIGLGVWQLRRAEWKEALLARFEAAQGLPPVAWPSIPPPDDSLLFRTASGFCLEVVGWRQSAGRNRAGQSGWRHIAACRTGAEGPGMQVDMGWSERADSPAWRGGKVRGVIAPDSKHRIMLVSAEAAPGLQPSAPPSAAEIPNNHRFYAAQWFAFAGLALLIYVIALRRRQKG